MIGIGEQRLKVKPLGEGAWRLCDHSSDGESADRLVAYVEQLTSGRFEAIWMGPGIRCSVHATREEILARALALRA